MTSPIDITGHWNGAYFQHGREHPLSAIFAQFDSHLQGKMTDGITEFDRSVFEAAMEAGLPPGADELIVARLRREHPEVARDPIRSASRIPQFSVLEGTVEGSLVRFVKKYLGSHFTGYKIGDQLFGESTEGHEVAYWGRLSDDGNSMEGQWSTGGDPKHGIRGIEGRFHLNREND